MYFMPFSLPCSDVVSCVTNINVNIIITSSNITLINYLFINVITCVALMVMLALQARINNCLV